MINAIIVDDEPHARIVVKNFLKKFSPNSIVIGEATTVSEAIFLINNSIFNVLFLDINLGNQISFDILDKINYNNYKIVFITAYDTFAIKAFKYSAVDYLLKPLDPELFVMMISKIENDLFNTTYKQIKMLIDNFSNNSPEKIAITTINEIHFIKTSDIIRLHSDGNYTDIYTISNKKTNSSKPIKYYEEILPKKNFIRIHQSHLINIDFIKKIIKNDNYLELENNTVIPISRRKKMELLKKLNL